MELHPLYDAANQPTKFCKNCIHSFLTPKSNFSGRECHKDENVQGISPEDGLPVVIRQIAQLRTNDALCGMQANWFEQKALPRGYESLGYDPATTHIQSGETAKERMERIKASAISSAKRNLRHTTVDDI